MNLEKLEKYRKPHPRYYNHTKGDNFGWFEVPRRKKTLYIQSSPSDEEWHHVSVSCSIYNESPSWEDMCFVKDLFFNDEDVVVQYHPKKSEYVNIAKNCLHLWKWNGGEFPTPNKILV